MLISDCADCDRPFVYTVRKRRKVRKICPSCVWARQKGSKKNYNDKHRNKQAGELKLAGRPSPKGNVTGVIQHSHDEIARALKMKRGEVERMEREVLLKIRNNPELKKLWDGIKDALARGGVNFLQGLISDPEDQGMRLLTYQMKVVEAWEVYQLMADEMRESGKDFSADITAMLTEIQRLQTGIVNALQFGENDKSWQQIENESWRPIATAPTTGRKQIWLKVPGREPALAHSNTWWIGGFSAECKPTHWKPNDFQ